MQTQKYQWIIDRDVNEKEVGLSGATLMNFFRSLYNKYSFNIIKPDQNLRIPKIIHQIWIGKEVPKELINFQKSWQIMHPTWEYRLWTQHDIPSMQLRNRMYIEQAQNPAEKADLLRYEILYQYGGFYVDMDFQSLQPLDTLNYMYDFVIGLQPLDCGLVQLGIGLIGSIPGHPLLDKCLNMIEANFNTIDKTAGVTVKTGPVYATKIFVQYADTDNLRNIALPAHYFYPLMCRQATCDPHTCLLNGSFGIHHWAKTWNKPEYRRAQFRSIESWGTLY
jgi:mannosyltransferase OCH1-like enzyme